MRIFKNTAFDFLRGRRWFAAASILLIAAGIVSLAMNRGPRYGIEFTGGAVLEVKCPAKPPLDALRGALERHAPGTTAATARSTAGELLTLTAPVADGAAMQPVRQTLEKALRESGIEYEFRSFDAVGPQMGAELRKQALLAAGVASAGMLAYVAWRLEAVYGVAAVAAVIHDVAVTLGAFSLAGQEVNLNVAAALLTLIGYSMNDTIVLFDRVAEILRAKPGIAMAAALNMGINQTLARTLLTAGLTLLAVLALLAFGGPVLRGFALALAIGIVAGTYSTVFVASPIVLAWHGRRR